MNNRPNADKIAARFWPKVNKTEGCWIWTGCTDSCGYGRFSIYRRSRKANRVAWFLVNGALPDGMNVCHKCDNPACVNPAHMFLGTRFDNMRDMVAKGRHKSPTAKLTPAMVRKIRASSELGVGELAAKFSVSAITIRNVLARRTWRSVK